MSRSPKNPEQSSARRSYAPAQTRQVLLDSALELFGAKGFHTTTVQEIVEQAGLTKGAFYHHFASKEDVLRLIHDEFLRVQHEALDRILSETDDPSEQLREIVRMSVLTVARYQAYVTVFFQERRYLSGLQTEEIKKERDTVEQQIEQVVQAGIAKGVFRQDLTPRIVVFGLLGMSAWVYQWFRESGQLSVERIADEMASVALQGIVAPG